MFGSWFSPEENDPSYIFMTGGSLRFGATCPLKLGACPPSVTWGTRGSLPNVYLTKVRLSWVLKANKGPLVFKRIYIYFKESRKDLKWYFLKLILWKGEERASPPAPHFQQGEVSLIFNLYFFQPGSYLDMQWAHQVITGFTRRQEFHETSLLHTVFPQLPYCFPLSLLFQGYLQ